MFEEKHANRDTINSYEHPLNLEIEPEHNN
jgi:hypothetical protein